MKIAINCSHYFPQAGGVKEYIFNLLHNIATINNEIEIIIYVSKDYYQFAIDTLPHNYFIKQTPFTSKSSIFRSLNENKYYQREEEVEKFDIFHSPFFHAPKLKKAKLLMTIHDMRIYRYPLTFSLLRYIFCYFKVKSSVRRSDKIISISHFTKEEIVKLCKIKSNKISVVHEAINRDFFSPLTVENYQPTINPNIISGDFILSVGHLEPRKNFNSLIKAFNDIENKNIKLIIAGKKNHGYRETLKLINQNKNIYYLEFVDSKLLVWLYKYAKLFVFPSFYEGFGFPPLEAAALGTVSAVSNVSSMPEICGESVIYFDPFDIGSMTQTINNALINDELIASKKELLKSRLDKFSWQKNAEETLKLYNEMMTNK